MRLFKGFLLSGTLMTFVVISVRAEVNPEPADRYVLQSALRFFNSGNYLDAVQSFEEALRNNPGDPVVQAYAAFSYFQLGRYAEAVEKYKRALELNPNYLTAQANLCGVYKKWQRLGEALTECRKASEMDPASPLRLNEYGWIQFELALYEDAKATFQRVIELDPALPATTTRLLMWGPLSPSCSALRSP